MHRRCALIVCLAACAGRTPERFKPGAPAAVRLEARPLGDGEFELTLSADTRADIGSLILELQLPPRAHYTGGALVRPIGRTTAGQSASLVARVRTSGRVEIAGGARLPGGGVGTSVVVGTAAKPAPAGRVFATPLGLVTEAGR